MQYTNNNSNSNSNSFLTNPSSLLHSINLNSNKLTSNSLLEWIYSTYKINLKNIENCATGALFCQILDSCHPGKIKLQKVNWKAKLEYEFITNFKILQEAFTDLNIKKIINVEKIIKGKLNDNLEFLQWMKNYYDKIKSNFPEREIYNAEKRRNFAELELISKENIKSCEKFVKKNLAKNENSAFLNLSKVNFDKNDKNNFDFSSINCSENKSFIRNNNELNSPGNFDKKFVTSFSTINRNNENRVNYNVKSETSLFSPIGNNEKTKELLIFENNKLNEFKLNENNLNFPNVKVQGNYENFNKEKICDKNENNESEISKFYKEIF